MDEWKRFQWNDWAFWLLHLSHLVELLRRCSFCLLVVIESPMLRPDKIQMRIGSVSRKVKLGIKWIRNHNINEFGMSNGSIDNHVPIIRSFEQLGLPLYVIRSWIFSSKNRKKKRWDFSVLFSWKGLNWHSSGCRWFGDF